LKSLPPNASPLPLKFTHGRPAPTSTIQDERLKRHVLKNPFKSARELKNEVPGWSNVSVRTIQHRLQKQLGLQQARRAAKKPLLTQKMKQKKTLACARK
jgi:hypothetical protein